ncbi:MAG TPA: HAD family hydrolase, partial [Actinobacteria bacterium]|nr:HAD family hydrolase [Actinomycetota bacterium]
LMTLSGPQATVVRGGTRMRITAADIVPGDLMVISTGDRISADGRLLTAAALEADESLLTGESTPVAKSTGAVAADAPLADRTDMVFSGTTITFGHGTAMVTNTGPGSQMGKIAELMHEAPSRETPLQQNLDQLGKRLAVIVLVIATIVAVIGFIATGTTDMDNAVEMLLFGVALAVAAIPEGLPAVVTAALALGTQRMAARKALVRRLPAVETLGSTTAICSDKTGTLTMGEMTVREIATPAGSVTVTGAGYAPEGELEGPPEALTLASKLARSAMLCNDASIRRLEDGRWQAVGNPTEASLTTLAGKMGMDYQELRENTPRLAEAQFSSERKRMSVVVADGDQTIIHSKGAPERIIPSCSHIITAAGAAPLDDAGRQELLSQAAAMASRALRTLAVATGSVEKDGCEDVEACEQGLIFLGLVGIADPPRPQAAASIKECYQAGIRVYMLTGDHRVTAQAIAAELGISGDAMTGSELDETSDEELAGLMEKVSIFARVSPSHKVRIVKALQQEGHKVAVTGDGVNDAPALKHADIGIAMGLAGTDVSREAADMVLADDNFATIVAAVEEGRSIFSNIRRFITFLLATNAGEILTLFLGVLIAAWLGLYSDGKLLLPLLAVQILWINLVTDGLPALALGVEPKHAGAMMHPPRPPEEPVINRIVWERIAVVGTVSAAGTLLLLDAYLPGGLVTVFGGKDIAYARTMAFVTLAIFQMFDAFNCRQLTHSVLKHMFGNRWLNAAVAVSMAMMVAVVHIPVLQRAFHTESLSVFDWLVAIAVGSLSLWAVELLKAATASRNQVAADRS